MGRGWDPDAEDTAADWDEDGDGNVTCTVTLICRRALCGETMDEIVVEETVSTDVEVQSVVQWSDIITAEDPYAPYENGAEIDFDPVVAAPAVEDVPEEDAAPAEESLNDRKYTALCLDIRVFMDILPTNDTEEAWSFEKVLNPITITVVIPEERLEEEGDTYAVIHVHDGEAEERGTGDRRRRRHPDLLQ